MKCYKVCFIVEINHFQGYLVDNPYRLYYSIGETTKPKIGKIFAFLELKHAVKFLNNQCCYRKVNNYLYTFSSDMSFIILEGEGIMSNIKPKKMSTHSNDIKRFWSHSNPGSNRIGKIETRIPDNTIFLDEFTPQRIVNKEDLEELNEIL